MSASPGKTLLHYRVVEELGRGAMGSVWRAADTTLDRDVALKFLPEALAQDPELLARFEREAKLLASVHHPNLAAVYAVHSVDSTRFLAMELVPGEDLSARLLRGALPPDEAIRVACSVAEAVEAAHGSGVIHRDLKPGNVRLTPDGRVKVLDFGLAKAAPGGVAGRDDSNPPADLLETTAGVVLGTAPYMSPEQVRCKPIDGRSDIWSFGCVLWECLTGERPFQGETMSDVLAAILHDEPDWTRLPADTPASAMRVLRRCLAKDPGRRYHHIADARIELEDAEPLPELEATQSPAPSAAPRPWVTGAVGVLLVAAITLLLLNLVREDGQPPAGASAQPNPLDDYDFKKLTNWPGAEFDAAISPDGRWVVFVSDHNGPFEIFAGQIDTGNFVPVAKVGEGGNPRMPVRKRRLRRRREPDLDGRRSGRHQGPVGPGARLEHAGDRPHGRTAPGHPPPPGGRQRRLDMGREPGRLPPRHGRRPCLRGRPGWRQQAGSAHSHGEGLSPAPSDVVA